MTNEVAAGVAVRELELERPSSGRSSISGSAPLPLLPHLEEEVLDPGMRPFAWRPRSGSMPCGCDDLAIRALAAETR